MVRFGCPDLETAMQLGPSSSLLALRPSLTCAVNLNRGRSRRVRHGQVRQADQARVREGLLPLLAHLEEALRWIVLDQAREVG